MSRPSAPATLTVTGRLLRTRGAVWAALLAAIGLVVCLLALRAAPVLQRADLGEARLDDELRVVAPGGGLRAGDRVIAVGGNHVDANRLAFYLSEYPSAGAITVTVERAGRPVDVVTPTRTLPALHLIALWVRVVSGVLCFLIGVVSFVLAPGSRSAWLYLVFCTVLTFLLLYNVFLVAQPWIQARVEAGSFALSAALGLHLFLELPRRVGLLERRPLLAGALIYLWAITLALWGALWPDERVTTIAAAMSTVTGAVAATALIRGLRAAADEPTRSRYRTLLVGLLIGLVLPVTIHSLRGILGIGQAKWIIHINALPVLIYAVAAAWALLRQNVLGADRVTTTVVSYFATLIALATAAGLALLALALLAKGRVALSPLALVAITAAASLSVVPLYRRVRAAVDRRFQRDRASDERMTRELRELMRVASLHRRAEAFAAAERTLGLLQPTAITIWLRDGTVLRHGEDTIPVDGPLVSALAEYPAAGVEGVTTTRLPTLAQEEMWRRELALAAPLQVHGELRGMVALGRRVSGNRYAAAEEQFLAAVAAQLAVVLERAGEDTLGRYRLVRRLGVGGMAEVFLARHIGLGGFERKVAIKRPFPDLMEDPSFVSMFLDEAKLAAQLHHPNVAQTLEVDRADGAYFIAMEYVEGLSLKALLRACRHAGERPPLPITIALVDALLRALAYAHAKSDDAGQPLGIVHRDITPGNLLVGVNGEVKLVDFGVARSATRAKQTQAGVVKGTLAYMPPEQATGRPVDARSDLFGVGAILVECLTGKPPYPDGPPRVAPTRLATLDGTPDALAAVVRKALSHEPAKRYARAEDMRRALLEAAGVPPASASELARWLRDVAAREVPGDGVALHEAATQAEQPTVVGHTHKPEPS